MTYFTECFICGSGYAECGHREQELLVWWMQVQRQNARRAVRIVPVRTDADLTAVSEPESIPIAPAPCKRQTDARTLSRGRMPWPQLGVTPEVAFAQRRQ